jgi:putative DNA primase/helicase
MAAPRANGHDNEPFTPTVTYFTDEFATEKREERVTLHELAQQMRAATANKKEALPWIKLARFGDVPSPTGSGCLRHDGNLITFDGITLDYDGEKMTFALAVAVARGAGLRAILHTSPTNVAGRPRWRVVCPTSRSMEPIHHRQMVSRVAGVYAKRGAAFDHCSWALSQGYYYGSIDGNPDHEVMVVEGAPVDLLDHLDETAVGPPEHEKREAPDELIVDDDDETLLTEARARVRRFVTADGVGGWRGDHALRLAGLLNQMRVRKKILSPDKMRRLMIEGGFLDVDVSIFGRLKQPAGSEDIEEAPVLSAGSPLTTAKIFSERRDGVKYLKGDFYEWRQTHYAQLGDDDVKSEIYRFLDKAQTLVEEKVEGQEKKKLKRVPFNPNKSKVENVLDALRGHTNVKSDLNAPAWIGRDRGRPILAMTNGLLRLSDMELLPFDRDYFNTSSLEFAYDPDAPEPEEWTKFLQSIWPNDEAPRNTLQEIMGYLVSGDNSLNKIFMINGLRRCGKGTIGRVLAKLIGPGGHAGVTLRSLNGQFGFQPLINKMLAIVPDARLQTRANQIVEALLAISGGDHLTVDRKNKTAWTGLFPTRFLFLTNLVPELSDASGVITSRFVTLEITVSFYGREDLGLEARLMRELPGILNWCLVGWRRLMERGHFAPPITESQRILDILAAPVVAFVEECCSFDKNGEVKTNILFGAWRRWCDKNSRPCGDDASFGRDLHASYRDRVVRKRHSEPPCYTYEGIKLKDGPAGITSDGEPWWADDAF